MIESGKCFCFNCYQEFDITDVYFKLTVNIKPDSVKSNSEVSTKKSTKGSLSEDDISGGGRNLSLDNENSSILPKPQEKIVYFRMDGDNLIVDPSISDKDIEVSLAPTKKDQNGYYHEVHVDYRIKGKNEVKNAVVNSRCCPCCNKDGKKQLHPITESMGFCDWYIILMFGDTYSGKTAYLRTILELSEGNFEKNKDICKQICGYSIQSEKTEEHEITNANLPRRSSDKKKDLFAYFKLINDITNKEVMFFFKDNPGEEMEYKKEDTEFRTDLLKFSHYVDAVMFFSDVFSMSGMVKNVNRFGIDSEKIKNSIYGDPAVGNIKKQFNKGDVIKFLRRLQILNNNSNVSALYVVSMTDVLKRLINREYGGEVPFDFSCDYQSDNLDEKLERCDVLLSTKSVIFRDVIHRRNFRYKQYFDCALETYYFLKKEDIFFDSFLNWVRENDYNLGVTAVASNLDDYNQVRRITEPFAWLIQCLINGKKFNMPLLDQIGYYYQEYKTEQLEG